jgi:5'-nucleotidase / UDP-sugar diphosphatase
MARTGRIIVALFCTAMIFMMSVPDVEGRQREIRILHMNDFHGFAEKHKAFGSDEVVGGIAYAAWRADALRKEKPTLLLAAGDMISGSNWANFFHGKPAIEVMNAMGFDAMALGNHELDFGQAVLRERITEARFPVLCANLEGIQGVKPYTVKEIDGIKVGIIGVLTEDAPVTTHPRNVAGLKFIPPFEAVERCVKELRDKVDTIIVLSHIGLNQDMLLASRVKGIDVIVGGHTHTKLAKQLRINSTIIVQAWEHGLALGVLDLTLKGRKIVNAKSHLEEISPTNMKKLSSVDEIVNKYKKDIDAIMDYRIGETLVDLDGKNVRLRETNLGNFVADVVREKAGADGTIINAGGIRASINKGQVTVKDIYLVLPFDNYVVAVKLTGKQIMEALEHGVSAVEDEEGRFPQVSGIVFTYSKNAKKGSRVKEAAIGGKPLDPNGVYIIATNDFMAVGGDGYKAFGEAVKSSKDYHVAGGAMKGENLVYSDAGKWVRDIVTDYIKAKKEISPAVEGRIKELP